jgi:hypothetical protein
MDTEGTIAVAQVPDYIEREFDLLVSRQTVYRWVSAGRRGVQLQAEPNRLGKLMTTKENVDDFLDTTGYQV